MTEPSVLDDFVDLHIPIRPDLKIRVVGIPWDLTEAEADKIARVINAYVNERR